MQSSSDEILQQTIDHFWEAIPPVWNTVRARVRSAVTQEFDITVEQFHILRHIRKGAHSVSELAEVGRISRPAISQALDALVGKGLVSRLQNVADRRYVQVELTPDGAALLNAVFDRARQWMKIKLTPLKADELQMVMSGLTLLKEAFCDDLRR